MVIFGDFQKNFRQTNRNFKNSLAGPPLILKKNLNELYKPAGSIIDDLKLDKNLHQKKIKKTRKYDSNYKIPAPNHVPAYQPSSPKLDLTWLPITTIELEIDYFNKNSKTWYKNGKTKMYEEKVSGKLKLWLDLYAAHAKLYLRAKRSIRNKNEILENRHRTAKLMSLIGQFLKIMPMSVLKTEGVEFILDGFLDDLLKKSMKNPIEKDGLAEFEIPRIVEVIKRLDSDDVAKSVYRKIAPHFEADTEQFLKSKRWCWVLKALIEQAHPSFANKHLFPKILEVLEKDWRHSLQDETIGAIITCLIRKLPNSTVIQDILTPIMPILESELDLETLVLNPTSSFIIQNLLKLLEKNSGLTHFSTSETEKSYLHQLQMPLLRLFRKSFKNHLKKRDDKGKAIQFLFSSQTAPIIKNLLENLPRATVQQELNAICSIFDKNSSDFMVSDAATQVLATVLKKSDEKTQLGVFLKIRDLVTDEHGEYLPPKIASLVMNADNTVSGNSVYLNSLKTGPATSSFVFQTVIDNMSKKDVAVYVLPMVESLLRYRLRALIFSNTAAPIVCKTVRKLEKNDDFLKILVLLLPLINHDLAGMLRNENSSYILQHVIENCDIKMLNELITPCFHKYRWFC